MLELWILLMKIVAAAVELAELIREVIQLLQ